MDSYIPKNGHHFKFWLKKLHPYKYIRKYLGYYGFFQILFVSVEVVWCVCHNVHVEARGQPQIFDFFFYLGFEPESHYFTLCARIAGLWTSRFIKLCMYTTLHPALYRCWTWVSKLVNNCLLLLSWLQRPLLVFNLLFSGTGFPPINIPYFISKIFYHLNLND